MEVNENGKRCVEKLDGEITSGFRKKRAKKRILGYFHLNKINEDYVEICNEILTEKYLMACRDSFETPFERSSLKRFMSLFRDRIAEDVSAESVLNNGLIYQKWRQEANEHALNWFKEKIRITEEESTKL
jgi:hypothetical protein